MRSSLHPYEYDFDFTLVHHLQAGVKTNGAHIRYRIPGTRRWTKFLIVGDPGEGIQAIDAKIDAAIIAHSEGRLAA